jgi:hypothetical protein
VVLHQNTLGPLGISAETSVGTIHCALAMLGPVHGSAFSVCVHKNWYTRCRCLLLLMYKVYSDAHFGA